MNIVPIGFGQFGTAVVDSLVRYGNQTDTDFVRAPTAVSTSADTLAERSAIPLQNRQVVGQPHTRDQPEEDAELAGELISDHRHDILDPINAVPTAAIDAFLLVTAHGDSLGSGGSESMSTQLTQMFPATPIYTALGLPPDPTPQHKSTGTDTSPEGPAPTNTTFFFDARILTETQNQSFHQAVAHRLGLLFSVDEGHQSERGQYPVIHTADLIEGFTGNQTAVVGYATDRIEVPEPTGILARLPPRRPPVPEPDAIDRLKSLVGTAASDGLSAPCHIETTQHTLGFIGAPRTILPDRSHTAVEEVLKRQTNESAVTTGIYPFTHIESMACVAVFVGVDPLGPSDEPLEAGINTTKDEAEPSHA